METVLILLILFLISIFSTLLYFKSKQNRLKLLNNKECPSCGMKQIIFIDKNTNTTFTQDVIKSRIIKTHGCSGVIEMEYFCKNCGSKEIHSTNSISSCSI